MRKYVEAIAVACCVCIIGLSLWFGEKAYREYANPQIVKPYVPKFKNRDCFIRAGLREPWSIDVEGMVILRGYTKYIVMYASEADRPTLIVKQGWEQYMREFDITHKIVPCPEPWLTHRSAKRKPIS